MLARYNPVGEWRPFVRGGDEDAARQQAFEVTDNLALIGPLIYVFYTGFNVLEFAVRSAFALPTDEIAFANGQLVLAKCAPVHPLQATVVYDGSFALGTAGVAELEGALTAIGQVVNRLAFAYRGTVSWRPKYLDFTTADSYAAPDESDLPRLDRFVTAPHAAGDAALLDAALDWHNRARGTQNPFNAFLSYYIPVEALAASIGEGTSDFGLGLNRETPAQRRSRIDTCIQLLHATLFNDKPVRFVERAYFQCIGSIRHRFQTAATVILGPDRTAQLFEPGADGYSLSEIRSLIAHRALAVNNPVHETLVRNRLGQMADLSREFLLRLLLAAPYATELPTWSGRYRAIVPFTDPRTLAFADPSFIAAKDWHIRPEWCE